MTKLKRIIELFKLIPNPNPQPQPDPNPQPHPNPQPDPIPDFPRNNSNDGIEILEVNPISY